VHGTAGTGNSRGAARCRVVTDARVRCTDERTEAGPVMRGTCSFSLWA